LKNCSNSLKHVIGSLDAGATPAASTKKTFRKCIGCGKDFVLVLDLPQVTHCSYKCLVDGGVLDSTDNWKHVENRCGSYLKCNKLNKCKRWSICSSRIG